MIQTDLKPLEAKFACQPNNRCLWYDQSLVPAERKTPDFKVCTQNYTVENNPKWSVGHTDEWAYKSKDEAENIG
mgnify:CR=1 FL=1